MKIQELINNKSDIIKQKKATIKTAASAFVIPKTASKAISTPSDNLKVTAIINTTNWMDSHGDVHIKGCFSKTVKEGAPLHVQEHKSQEFDKIIASGPDLKAYVQTVNLKDLGYEIDHEVEAYTFDSNVRKERNPYMWHQYAKGWVNNHSIGMQYVKMFLCVDPEQEVEADEEKENWNKYFNQIINQERAKEQGYFWAVTELKALEGSAVPIGSNVITPTQNIEAVSDTSKQQPSIDTVKSLFNLLKFQ